MQLLTKSSCSQNIHAHLLNFTWYGLIWLPRLCLSFLIEAENCLKEFVRHGKEIYGLHFLSYNVHNLLHLCDDDRRLNVPVDFISAFVFENYFVHVKQAIKSPFQPLKQLCNQLKNGFFDAICEHFQPQFIQNIDEKPSFIPVSRNFPEYFHVLKLNNFFLSSSNTDCFFMTKSKLMCRTLCIIRSASREPIICCRTFDQTRLFPLYEYPLCSSSLGIFKFCGCIFDVENLSNDVIFIEITSVLYKILCLPLDNQQFAIFPMDVPISLSCLHCNSWLFSEIEIFYAFNIFYMYRYNKNVGYTFSCFL